MKHYVRTDSGGAVWGYSASDVSPGSDWVEIAFSAEGITSRPNRYQLVDGSLVDTGQPSLPPQPWMVWDRTQVQWVDARDLAALKSSKWTEIKSRRDGVEHAGFSWDGSTFDSDPISQSRIQGAAQLASLSPASFQIDWTLADNSVRSLAASDMLAVGQALAVHVNAQHVLGRILRQQIESATTAEQVAAIQWPE